jgi:hypothetical protein
VPKYLKASHSWTAAHIWLEKKAAPFGCIAEFAVIISPQPHGLESLEQDQ